MRVDERLVSLVKKLASCIHGEPVTVRVSLGKGKVSSVEVVENAVDAEKGKDYKSVNEHEKP